MADYKHGVYGQVQVAGSRVSQAAQNAMIYIGTAPVHMVADGGKNVNSPIVCENIAQARAKLGYSEEWEKYSLCEAMKAHFLLGGVGPVIFINVLNPAKHKKKEKQTKSLTPENGMVIIQGAQDVILDSLSVTGKTAGEDYVVSSNLDRHSITLTEVSSGALGTEALNITYEEIDPSQVTAADVVGTTDGYGLNTGVYAVQNVYQTTGYIPSFLLAPGFSGDPEVHAALAGSSRKIGGHWDAYILADLPITDSEGSIGMDTAPNKKKAKGMVLENETVYYPMALGTDGQKYHLSTLAAANLQKLMSQQDGIPYKTASNTEVSIIQNLYLGENDKNRVFPDSMINEKLCKAGIASAAFVGGKWVIWGAHSADYDEENGDALNISETNRMMLYYIANDFQHRRADDVDKPMTRNDMQAIVAQEQARLDALLKIGALAYGECHLDVGADQMGDIVNGDFRLVFNVTTTPLAKSLTASVYWTKEGIETYYASFANT